MTTPEPGPGNEIFVFHRTMSFGNWPFLVLILIIAGVVSAPSMIDGDWKGALLIIAAVTAFPLFIGAIYFFPELFGNRVLVGVHARGIVWARLWQRGFIPWENLEQHGTVPTWQFIERRDRGKPISLQATTGASAAAAFIAERLPAK